MVKVCVLHCNPKIVGMIHNVLTQFDVMVTVITGYKYELEYYVRHKEIDIVIIHADYITNDYDGFFVSQRIKIIQRKVLVIYISQSDNTESLIRMINSEPFAFVYYNQLAKELPYVMDRAISLIKKDTQQFTYKKSNENYTVSLKNVIYFMSCHRTIQYICLNGDKDEFYDKMDSLEKSVLSLTSNFIRIHQSYFINMDLILSVENNSVKMVNEEIIVVSRKYHKNLDVIKNYKSIQ